MTAPWTPAACPPELLPGQIHVWRARLQGRRDRLALWGYLDADERRRAQAFYREVHGERFASARGLLRRLVAAYTGQSPVAVRFATGPYGKPELAPPQPPLAFNLSHSEDMALVAFARQGRLGVDVEWVRALPDALAMARRNFSPAEVHWFTTSPPGAQAEVFFRIWTRKEAVLKAVGAGLSIDLQAFDVVAVRGAGETVPMSLVPGLPPEPWRWFELQPAPDFRGCVVSDRPVEAIATFEAADVQ